MNVTLRRGLTDQRQISLLWDLYSRAYSRIAVECVLPEVLDEFEFREVLSDPSTRTYIAWDGSVPVGLSCVATDMNKVPWLNPRYLRQRFPEHAEARRIRYAIFSVVDPEYSGTRAMFAMMRRAMEVEAADESVLIVDVIRANQRGETGGMPAMLERMARSVADADVEEIEVHRFFSLDFAEAAARKESATTDSDDPATAGDESIEAATSQ